MPYPFDSDDLAALVRLDTFYNRNSYDAGTNAGGMGNGGHRINFIPALDDLALVVAAAGDAADAASDFADAASASASDASTSNAKLTGTSTSSVLIGAGSKAFTTQSGKSFDVGTFVTIRSDANPTTHYMAGQITAYATTSLTVNVTVSSGSGSRTDWTIYGRAGSPGVAGNTGATGATGNTPALQWQFGNGTVDGDPGNGIVLFNNATYSSVTQVFFDNLDASSTTQTAFLDSLDDSTNTANRGSLFFQQISDPTIYARFTITGAVTDGTGYRKVVVTPDNSHGTFTNGATVAVVFSRTGNAGADGAGAGDVISDETSVVDGDIVIFNGTGGKHVHTSSVGIGTSGTKIPKLSTANTWGGVQSFAAAPLPSADDGAALGSTSFKFSDLFLASGAVVNFNNGDVTVTHSSNALAFAGAATNYTFDALVAPATSDGAALGSTSLMWSDLFLASGGVINFNNGDVTVTHSTNILTFGGAANGYRFDALVAPSASDGAALGSTSLMWSDGFFASGAVLNFNNGNVTVTHSTGKLALVGALDVSGNISPNGGGAIRKVLTGAQTYYVRTDGSDSNNGLANTSGGAFLTIQKAIDTAMNTLDTSGYAVTIFVADGTYTGAVSVGGPLVGNARLYIIGNSSTPANCIISTTSATAVSLSYAANVYLQGFKITTTTSGDAINLTAGAQLQILNLNFGATASGGGQISIGAGCSCTAFADYTISSGALYHTHTALLGTYNTAAITITSTGTPAWAAYFAGASLSGCSDFRNVTFSGSATGSRYTVHNLAIIMAPTTSLTALPGNSNGTEGSGGVYYMGESAINHAIDLVGAFGVTGDITFTGAAWTSFTPTITASTGTFTTVGTITAKYRREGKTVRWYARIPITTLGTAAGRMIMTLPPVASNGSPASGEISGWHEASFKGINGAYNYDAAEKASFTTADGTFPITGNGQTVNLGGFYEAV